ncbi:ribokinase [Saccharothrix violaceirubra]|uniref:Ribokinase n=1 Tax=Saccharothrix violaceirubra TaxID=413306 RepID=A0A7W7TA80_9PSEU|nr:ribokinase [Saccharothrix violaceirubra]
MTILVLGSANADLVVTVPHRPRAGETVLGGDVRTLPGGKGANTAVAAARLGARVVFAGAVGRDGHGELLRTSLADAGVDTAHLRTSDRPTGTAHITVTPDGENSIVVSPGANADLRESDIDALPWQDVATLVCSLEIPVPVVCHAIRTAAGHGVRAVLNLSPVTDLPDDVLPLLDPLVVNEQEAEALGTSVDVPRATVITLGADGARLGDRRFPASRVRAVDTTGAGDAFTGALVRELDQGVTLPEAVGFAIRAAAWSVTREGAQPSYPDLADLSGERGRPAVRRPGRGR